VLNIAIPFENICITEPVETLKFVVGPLAAGHYTIEVVHAVPPNTVFATYSFDVIPVAVPAADKRIFLSLFAALAGIGFWMLRTVNC